MNPDTDRRHHLIIRTEIAVIALILFLSCNYLVFGHYADDIKWVLTAENFLKFSVQAPWLSSVNQMMTWGTSLFLLPIVGVFGRTVILFKLYMAALLFSGMFLFFQAIRRSLSNGEQYWFLAALMLNSFVLSFSGGVISEAPYLFLFSLGIYLLFAGNWREQITAKRLVVLCAITALLILTRASGIVFFICLIIELLLARRIKMAVLSSGLVILLISPYYILSKMYSGSVSFYTKYWHKGLAVSILEIVQNALSNLYYYWKGLAGLTYINGPGLFPGSTVAKFSVLFVISALCVYGFTRIRRRDPFERFLMIYFAGYALLHIVWPYRAPRYALPAYPIFIYLFFKGIAYIKPAALRSGVFIVFAAISLVSNMPSIADSLKTSLTQPPEASHASYDWLKEHTAEDDLIVSMDIARIYYYAGRKGIPFVPSESLQSFVRNSRRMGVRYYLVRESGFTDAAGTFVDPIARQYKTFNKYMNDKTMFDPVYKNTGEGITVYTLATGVR